MRDHGPTVADIRALKGKRQLTMLYVDTPDEAAAAAKAGIAVAGHVGSIPSKESWAGDFKAVGKTAASALSACHYVKANGDLGGPPGGLRLRPARRSPSIRA